MLEDFSGPGLCIGERCSDVGASLRRADASNIRFCKNCYERVEAELADLPRTYHGLVDAMLPSPQRMVRRSKGARSAAGMRINEDASSGRSEILGFLRSWSALVADERPVRRPAGHDCRSMTSFLLAQLDWLLAHPAAGDFEQEMLALVARLRKVTDLAPTHFDIGPCARPGCDARLFAAASAGNGRYEVQCASGHVWQSDQWLQLYRRLRGA